MTFPRRPLTSPMARMPLLGFGTWQIKGVEASDSVGWALDAGYRHLDTATVYGNEKEVGPGSPRAVSPATTSSSRRSARPSKPARSWRRCASSLDLLGTDRVDLWLIHWPGGDAADVGVWRGFVEAREQGLARDIGVSNYSLAQIDERLARTGVTPAVNQVEWSPLLFDRAVAGRSPGTRRGRSRATARCAAAPSSTRPSSRSPSASAVRRPRSSSAGTCSTASSSSPSRCRSSGSGPTPRSADFTLTDDDMAADSTPCGPAARG